MQVMHDDDNNITICTALYQSSGFFIIMSPAEGLHFSALVYYSLVSIKIIKPELYTATSQQHHITAASLGELSIRIIIQACFYKIILSKGTKIVRLNARVQKYNLTAENYTVT